MDFYNPTVQEVKPGEKLGSSRNEMVMKNDNF